MRGWRFPLAALALLPILFLFANAQPMPRGPDPAEVTFPGLFKGEPIQGDPKDGALLKLKKERYNAALGQAQARYQEFLAGRAASETLMAAVEDLFKAKRALATTPEQSLAALQGRLDAYRAILEIQEVRFQAGRLSTADVEQARTWRLTAEIELLEAKEAKK